MNVTLRPNLWLLSVGVIALVSLAASAQDASGSFDRTLNLTGPARLDVRSGAGSITIRRGAADRVHVTGRITVWPRAFRSSADARDLVQRLESDPPIDVSGNQVRIGYFGRDADGEHVSISYEIEVPTGTEVASRTGSGNQDVSGVGGPTEVHTGSGNVVLRDVGGPVVARTGSGSIRAEAIAGAFDGQAGSGSIALTQVEPGDVSATTGSGSVSLRGVRGALRAHTGSGLIDVQGEQKGAWDLESGSGAIRIDLPDDAAFDLDARAGSGGVHTSRPLTIQGSIDTHHVVGRVGSGGPELHVQTGSGRVTID